VLGSGIEAGPLTGTAIAGAAKSEAPKRSEVATNNFFIRISLEFERQVWIARNVPRNPHSAEYLLQKKTRRDVPRAQSQRE
jgi:hypothetical protein